MLVWCFRTVEKTKMTTVFKCGLSQCIFQKHFKILADKVHQILICKIFNETCNSSFPTGDHDLIIIDLIVKLLTVYLMLPVILILNTLFFLAGADIYKTKSVLE